MIRLAMFAITSLFALSLGCRSAKISSDARSTGSSNTELPAHASVGGELILNHKLESVAIQSFGRAPAIAASRVESSWWEALINLDLNVSGFYCGVEIQGISFATEQRGDTTVYEIMHRRVIPTEEFAITPPAKKSPAAFGCQQGESALLSTVILPVKLTAIGEQTKKFALKLNQQWICFSVQKDGTENRLSLSKTLCAENNLTSISIESMLGALDCVESLRGEEGKWLVSIKKDYEPFRCVERLQQISGVSIQSTNISGDLTSVRISAEK